MKTFEVTAPGFDGSSDDTDDRVIWVQALSEADVEKAIEGTGSCFHGQIDVDSDIDFRLPEQLDALRLKLLAFKVVE